MLQRWFAHAGHARSADPYFLYSASNIGSIAALVGYGGVLVIAARGDVLGLQFDSVRGVTLALLSTVVWAYYWIISTRNQRIPGCRLILRQTLKSQTPRSFLDHFSCQNFDQTRFPYASVSTK